MTAETDSPRIRTNIPLAEYTSLGLGGPARYFAAADSVDSILEVLNFAQNRRLTVQVIGGGSNIVFGDKGYDGLVLHMDTHGVSFRNDGESVLVAAAAGEQWDTFVSRCIEKGLGGIECLSGIPGLVGATPIQNVGAYGQEVADTITSIRAIHRPSLATREFAAAECGFGYRRSRFKTEEKDQYIILDVTFRLAAAGQPAIRYAELQKVLEENGSDALQTGGARALGAVREAVIAIRRRKSMVVDPKDPDSRSVGSFFTNPVLSGDAFALVSNRWCAGHPDEKIPTFESATGVKIPAAWLVEKSGYPRGLRYKGVGISRHHSLALVNYHGTTAELLELAGMIEAAVYKEFAIHLEREPVIIQ